ncbi:MAG: hypothetical protein ACC645_10510 [Pirellulales bacterium]
MLFLHFSLLGKPAVPSAVRTPSARSLRLVAWLALMVPLSVAIAWFGVDLEQRGFAPLGLHSLAVGLLLGGAAVVAFRLANVASRRAVMVAIVAVAPATAFLEHVIAYTHYRASYHQAVTSNSQIALLAGRAEGRFMPASFADYLRAQADARSLGLWVLDAALLTSGASIPLLIALRFPYCRACNAWCRTVRSGPLTPDEISAWSRQLATELPPRASDVRYHAAVCRAGCRHDLMRLSWRESKRYVRSDWVEGDSMARHGVAPAPE